MKRKFIRDISVNSLQVIINQVSGLVIFYVLSAYFSKNEFGEINWSLAILLTAFSILSFGIDQVTVKKIAAGEDARSILSTYIMHVLLAGGLFYGLLLCGYFIFPGFFHHHNLLLFLGIGKLMIFFSMPFKQLANGLEKFRSLFYMSICSNVIRGTSLILLSLFSRPHLTAIIVIFVAGDLAELLLSVFITKKILKVPLAVNTSKINYLNLLKESLPQVGVVIFTSAIARFDWIILGILASNIIVAEYSFAFKVFEITTLPLLVIAPVLIPLFTRLFYSRDINPGVETTNYLFILLRFEMIIASTVALMLNILWIPVIDFITHGKYGTVNRYTILLLSACMPFIYANNFFWTINFARGELTKIFYIFLITFLVNVACDLGLIPFYGAEGAAAGYLMAILIQFFLFRMKTAVPGLKKYGSSILLSPVAAFASGCLAIALFNNTGAIFVMSIIFFIIILIFTRQVRYPDWPIVRRIMGF
jgi:O-antigen/teichoic acid export membrane protein